MKPERGSLVPKEEAFVGGGKEPDMRHRAQRDEGGRTPRPELAQAGLGRGRCFSHRMELGGGVLQVTGSQTNARCSTKNNQICHF